MLVTSSEVWRNPTEDNLDFFESETEPNAPIATALGDGVSGKGRNTVIANHAVNAKMCPDGRNSDAVGQALESQDAKIDDIKPKCLMTLKLSLAGRIEPNSWLASSIN